MARRSATTGAALPIDPTANVTSQLASAVQRLDDLREVTSTFEEKLRITTEKFQDKLDAKEAERLDANARAEANRLDALGAAAGANVALALDRAATAALALQNQVTTSAEVLRSSAAATKDAQDKAIAAMQLILAQSNSGVVATEKAQARGVVTQGQLVGAGVLFLAALTYLHQIHVF